MADFPSDDVTTQHLRDFKVAIEFKYLTKHAPGGVYVIPEFSDFRFMHGVIFVRRGYYRDGIFRFTLRLPKEYNSLNSYPEIRFTPPIFNPLIHPTTGLFDLATDPLLQQWSPEKHFIITALNCVKKIFYLKSLGGYAIISNVVAARMFDADKEAFFERCQRDALSSLERINDPQPRDCTIIFSEPPESVRQLHREKLFGLSPIVAPDDLKPQAEVVDDRPNTQNVNPTDETANNALSKTFDPSNEAEDEEDAGLSSPAVSSKTPVSVTKRVQITTSLRRKPG